MEIIMVRDLQPTPEPDPALPVLDRLNPNRSSTAPSPALGRLGQPGNAALLEDLYEQWKTDPASVEPVWRGFFEGFELGCQLRPPPRDGSTASVPTGDVLPQARLYNLLFAYRALGHTLAHLDPLGIAPHENPDLALTTFRFNDADLDRTFDSGTLGGGGPRTLRDILAYLRETYCGTLGVEFMHIMNFAIRRWLRDRMERNRNQPVFTPEQQRRILEKIIAAESLERFLHTRYVGQKRFSLEGGETLIAALDSLLEACPAHGVEEVVIGMAHRGRLNVLVNTLGKTRRKLFTEFHENYVPETVLGDGDVKYHLGYENTVVTSDQKKIRVSLAPNPSHLEAVDPVVEGKARARQRHREDTVHREKVLPILIHGDGAFIGQGVVAETLNLSKLEGYKTGGTIHIIVNNQIAFTTLPIDSRSTRYCTAPAKSLGLPIFHINGDDPLTACAVIQMALEFRQKFHEDIVLDIVCYRKHGHNEGDEPNFTQPTLYSEIDQHPSVSRLLARRLLDTGIITEEQIQKIRSQIDVVSEDALRESREAATRFQPKLRPDFRCPALLEETSTGVPGPTLAKLGRAISTIPGDFQINTKIRKMLDHRRAMAEGKATLDWAGAEHLAFASLLVQGHPIRLSGQDSRRGTFSQRHSAIYDLRTRARYIPLKNLSKDQASFCVYNSPLSEAAVLGFDYGYSLDCPEMLVLWEAQFGDFANGAQTQIDQYIAAAESKWGVTSRITLLLPHGYHGQGPEHSSARLERFLQLCAEDNWVVTYPTTPANYFHLLRRQSLRKTIKPLVVMTPKGMLRDPRATSPVKDCTRGCFEEILPDPAMASGARRIILCAGKVYYDLAEFREKHGLRDTAIIRLEQIYPLHEKKLQAAVAKHAGHAEIVWCQEEPRNMGAWNHLESRLRALFGKEIRYAGRRASASPATGALAIHLLEQNQLLASAFNFKAPIQNPKSEIPPTTRHQPPATSSKTSVGPRSVATPTKAVQSKLVRPPKPKRKPKQKLKK
jgi:2-oxoglutarate dehydrogenase E1 component